MINGAKYIQDFTHKIPSPYGPLDSEGIPLFDLKILRQPTKLVYHPIVIIQYGLGNYSLGLGGCAHWVEKNLKQEPEGRFSGLYYSFPLTSLRINPPWISGMTQGQALSLLTRAYKLKPTNVTSNAARMIAHSFLYSVEEGGFLQPTLLGNFFIEEVVSIPPVHILNGALYAIYGLYEYIQCFNDNIVFTQYEKCLNGILEMLPKFDLGWWSNYSIGVHWNLASQYYHDVHILLLNELGTLFQEDLFLHYAEKWEISGSSHWNQFKCSLMIFIGRLFNLIFKINLLHRFRFKAY